MEHASVKKVLYVSGTRADFGLMRETLSAIEQNASLTLEVAVTGMHLMPQFGNTQQEIERENFKTHIVNSTFKDDSKASMSLFIADFISKLTNVVEKTKPDIILILGDRPEALAAAIVGSYMGICVAHVAGGDVTSTVDEHSRHAITKLSHIHFPSTQKSANRLIQMGEKHITISGAPGIDKITEFNNVIERFNIDSSKELYLILFHPSGFSTSNEEMIQILDAIKEEEVQKIIIYPNADHGSKGIIEMIKQKADKNTQIFKNVPRKDFLGILNIANLFITNSSSGIVESPSFKLPTINIGDRQEGREKSTNIIDCRASKEEIVESIKIAKSKAFQEKCEKCVNLYGEGNAYKIISETLANLTIKSNLIQKKFVDLKCS